MSEQNSMPVYRTLLEADLRERVAKLESTIGRKIVEVRELDDGYALRFPAEAGIVEELGRSFDFERNPASSDRTRETSQAPPIDCPTFG
jgi:hypothetical protein